MVTIQTATGSIDTAGMGFTLMHEHVMVNMSNIYQQYPELLDREKLMATALRRMQDAMAAGVRTMVDLTPLDLGREPLLLAEVSRRTGMQIIVATGLYYHEPYYFNLRPDREIVDTFVRDITVGISTTGVRANVIKAATQFEMDAVNERVLRAAARAHRETGVPICTHTHAPSRTGLDQQRVFKEEGVDLGRVVIGHSDDSDDITYLEEIIQNGSYCGMDRIGVTRPRDDGQRADMVAALVARGYAGRITLSHDSMCHADLLPPEFGERMPDWNYSHIPRRVIPMLKERGVSDGDIEQMTVLNPRRIFEQNAAY